MNLIILIILNPDRFAPSNIKLNKNGVMAKKSIMLSGDNTNWVKVESKAVELNILKKYSEPKNMNK